MKNGLTIALAISLVLSAAAIWGSCAIPHRVAGTPSPTLPLALAYSQSDSGESPWHSIH